MRRCIVDYYLRSNFTVAEWLVLLFVGFWLTRNILRAIIMA